MKERIARISLAVAVSWFILGGFVMGYAPEWFALAGIFATVPVVLGKRWVRIWAVVLLLASVAATISNCQGRVRENARAREIRERAKAPRSN